MVTYNSRPFLPDFFNSLKISTQLPYHLFIFDNNSTDTSRSYLERLVKRDPFWRRVKLILNPKNTNLAAVWNHGIDLGTGKYIVLLNPDIKFTPSWLETMVDCAERFPAAGIIGAKIVHFNDIIDHAGFKDGIVRGRNEPNDPQKYNTPVEVDMIHGCCFLIKRAILPVVGKFDEQFFLYGEENDYCIRVKQAGFSVMVSPAVIYHFGAGAAITISKRRLLLKESVEKLNNKWKN